ncbi:hypothetical protein BKP45_01725 [Anaerobacillus alkalidiazotrophicus]|uniref:histidine kinase n=1 Tax=Anaerobacillus alkalidiazotrophicus TaxID=472963 RepID=A0A1S2MAI0_9BACI|nr:HAMP domain-containing sensor histidine kinase [Anaerobacillus alkalidiazotrophicus]OIJ21513.1 hypothetical protein BKP45_01725 [Anaerobacillus alkalidiazotrophicus]
MNKKWMIQKKFLYGFLFIFSISLILLNIVLSNMLYKNSESIIITEMKNTKTYSREYIKQHLLLNNLTGNVFSNSGNHLAQELSQNLQSNVTLYDIEGTFLYEALGGNEYVIVNTIPSQMLQESSEQDLQLALDNKAAYTINKLDKQWIVNFSYPLHVNGEHYGIVRLSKDYTPLFESNQEVVTSIILFTLLLFLIIFLFSFVLSSKIIKPLTKMTHAFSEVAKGNYSVSLNIKTGDEIEELNDRFHIMKDQIKEQIEVITTEKEKVIKLEKSRREFFNNVTHELKTPLTTISGYSQILAEDNFNDPEFLKKAARRIHSESDRLHQMVVDVIELSKQHSNEMKKVDLTYIVTQLCEDMQLKAAKYNMTLQCKKPEQLTVYGVENRLLEVIINLLDNAIKYGENNSSINVSLYSQSNNAIVQVSNRCNHFNSSILSNAFEPFYRGSKITKDEKGSIGLGLYICKQIINEHQGTISIVEEQGLITFKISLPLRQQLGNM